MPTFQERAQIQTAFAAQYDLDLSGINKDARALREYILTLGNSKDVTPPSECYTYNGPQDFAPNIETISAADVKPDERLQIRQVEMNLDEAAKYVQACQAIRGQYGELVRHRSETRFKGEEFLRLDDVHQQEIDAGLYQLPWQEAHDEGIGLDAAIKQVNEQQNIPQELLGELTNDKRYSKLLTEAKIDSNIEDNAFIAENTANNKQDDVLTKARSTYNSRGYIELAAWQETLAGAKANFAQLTSKLTTAQRKEKYLRLDEGFKLQRRNISRQLAWLQIAEHCRIGSELNFDERLKQRKALFEANIGPLVERALVIEKGVKDIYGISLPLGMLETGKILDRISIWLVNVTDAVSKWKRNQRLSVVQLVSAADVETNSANGTLKAQFSVSPSDMPDAGALLRGANFEFVGDCKIPLNLNVSPPDAAALGASGRPLRFGRVCPVAPDLDLRPQHSDVFWNGSATGVWSVSGTYSSSAGSVGRLLMYLWVVSP